MLSSGKHFAMQLLDNEHSYGGPGTSVGRMIPAHRMKQTLDFEKNICFVGGQYIWIVILRVSCKGKLT
jgi:hypothetical protein